MSTHTSESLKATLNRVFGNDTWVKPYFTKYRKPLAAALLIGLVTYAFAALLMFTAGYLICRTAEETYGVFMVLVPIALVQLFGIGKPIARYLERLISHDWVFRMTSSLRQRLYTVLERRAMDLKSSHQMGEFLGLVAEDIGHIQNLYLRSIFPTVIAWLLYAAVVIGLGFVSPAFALFALLAIGVTVFLLPLTSVLANRARTERVKATTSDLYTQLTDNVLGAADWAFAGRGEEYLERYRSAEQELRRDQAALDRYAHANDVVATLIFGIIATFTIVWAAMQFGGQVGGPANWIAAFVLGFFPLVEVFMPLPMAATQAYGHFDSISRLNNLPGSDQAPPILDSDEGVRIFARAKEGVQDIDVDLPTFEANTEEALEERSDTVAPDTANLVLDIDHVSFAYEQGQPVLDDICLRVEPGTKLALLGRSGSGKSTLAKLIRGDAVPSQGSVTLGGAQTCQMPNTISNYIGLVAQQAYLFNRTLRDNLTLGRPTASDEEVWDALAAVGLDDMVQRLDDGLNTLVDESGTRFSGGERHRIALARVLLADVDVVLLDEPTVGLDPITEADVLETLFRVLEGKTLIMITHHLQGASAFDRIVFIEDGKIELDGSPAQLEATSERYRQLLEFDRGIA